MDELRLRIAREKWLGDAETAMRTPMRARDAFDAGYEAAERETLERAAQIVAGGDISPMTISKQLYEQHRLNGWENPTPDEAIVATLIYVSKALRDLGKG